MNFYTTQPRWSSVLFLLFFSCISSALADSNPVWTAQLQVGNRLQTRRPASIRIELFQDQAPKTVAHLMKLIQTGFYTGQRVLGSIHVPRPFLVRFGDRRSAYVSDRFFFDAQTGLPHVLERGSWQNLIFPSDPVTQAPVDMDMNRATQALDEESYATGINDENGNSVRPSSGSKVDFERTITPFVRGVVGFSHPGTQTNDGDSELFITLGRFPFLDDQYTAVGQVVAGSEVLDELGYGDQLLENQLQ